MKQLYTENSAFTSNIKEVYGDNGILWLKSLPEVIAKLSASMNFDFLGPVDNLTFGYVCFVKIKSTGERAILKITPPTGPALTEHKWLTSFSSHVPKVFNFDEQHNALLMEEMSPGHTLKTLVQNNQDDEATKIICETIRNLQQNKIVPSGFKHLSELMHSLDFLDGRLDNKILSKAKRLFTELTSDRTHDVLLHGDLHHDNILLSGSEWKVIDPHGYVGDAAFESSPMIYNPLDAFPTSVSKTKTIQRRLEILCDELAFDPVRIKGWAFCMSVLSIAWTVEGSGNVPEHEKELAEILGKII